MGYLHFRDTFGVGDVEEKGDRVLKLTTKLAPDAPGTVTFVAPRLQQARPGRG